MDLLDSTIAQTAAPAIRRDLGGSDADLEWITAADTLAMAATLLLGSRLGDAFGRRRVLLFGIAGFVGASALCALTPSPEALVGARARLGATGRDRARPGATGRDRGDHGAARVRADPRAVRRSRTAASIRGVRTGDGPRRGGGTTAGRRPRRSEPVRRRLARDLLIQGGEHGWPAWSFALLAAGVVTLVAFAALQARRSRQGRTTLVEPSILRRRPYVAGLAVVVGFIGAMGAMMIALNVMFQTGLGLTPLACGIATVAIPVAAIGGSITSSALLARIGRSTMHIGIVTMALGLVVVDLVLRSASGGVSRRAPALRPPTACRPESARRRR
ncbi:MAG: MFS transporter [Solirubrobacteraceae bacterium]